MTTLQRTQLSASDKVDFAVNALTCQEKFGGVTELSQTMGVSRPTVYDTQRSALEVLGKHFSPTSSDEDPIATVAVTQAQLKRTLVALRASSPNSLRAIEELLPIIYPGVTLSYGKIQALLAEAEEHARAYNEAADLSAIKAGALDEMFSQGEPVLAGVDLDSGFLFSLALKDNRKGDDWAAVLRDAKAQKLDLDIVVKDAAPGIALGVSEVFPDAEQRDDCFHVKYKLNKVRRRLETRAYALINAEMACQTAVKKARGKPRKHARLKRQLTKLRKQGRQAIADHDQFNHAYLHVDEAMEAVDVSTMTLRQGQQAQAMFEEAATCIANIARDDCRKVATYLRNRAPGLSLATQSLYENLGALVTPTCPLSLVTLVCALLLSVSRLKGAKRHWQKDTYCHHVSTCFEQLQHEDQAIWQPLMKRIQTALQHRYRASSAIEGFNAALRPFLYVHKGVTQGFLELFQARYNLKTRRWGRHKGTSAHEVLTGHRVNDWLSELGYPLHPATVH